MDTLLEGKVGFRLGLCEPGNHKAPKLIGPVFQPCRLDAAAMKLAMDRFNKRKPRLELSVFLVEQPCES